MGICNSSQLSVLSVRKYQDLASVSETSAIDHVSHYWDGA